MSFRITLFGLVLALSGCLSEGPPPRGHAPQTTQTSSATGARGMGAKPGARRSKPKATPVKRTKTAPKMVKKAAPPTPQAKKSPKPAPKQGGRVPRGPPKQVLPHVVVSDWGKPIHTGRMDLRPSISRILAGKKDRHRNDGAIFRNREGRLPRKARGYYREYVHPTKGMRAVGPQRLIVGRDGDWWYTPDHYKSFIPLQ